MCQEFANLVRPFDIELGAYNITKSKTVGSDRKVSPSPPPRQAPLQWKNTVGPLCAKRTLSFCRESETIFEADFHVMHTPHGESNTCAEFVYTNPLSEWL